MRRMGRGVGRVVGFSGLLVLLVGCPEATPGGEDDAASDEGGSGVGARGGTGGSSGDGGSGGAGTGGAGTGGGGVGGTDVDKDGGAAGSVDKDGGAGGSEPACEPACERYQHCELVQVTCIQAPCPPLPECVDNPSCGGFAGFTCPGLADCEDDPRDDCDPDNGGADCGGVCVCASLARCGPGTHWDAKACDCIESAADAGSGDGVPCGKNTCEVGQVCCNASCGLCAPPDGACIQIACQ